MNKNTPDAVYVSHSIEELNKYDTESYAHADSVVFKESTIPFPSINSGLENTSIIESALTDLSKIVDADVNPLISFFTAISNSSIIDDADIVLSIPNLAEVDKIRPQFLSAEVNNIKTSLEKFLKGKLDGPELIASADKVSLVDTKKNMCKTILDTTKDMGELAREIRGDNVHINKTVIRDRIVPFFKTFVVNYANIVKEADAVITAIKSSSIVASQIITAYNSATANMDRNREISSNRYLYIAIRRFIELRSYIAFIMTRKILNFTHTVTQYHNLYNYLMEKYPEGTRIMHESVLDGDLSMDVDDSTFYKDMISETSGSIIDVKIDAIVDRRSNDIADFSRRTNGVNALDTVDISVKYNKDIYESIVNIYKSFISRVRDFESAIMAGDQFDDAMNQTGFDGNVALKYNSIISDFAQAEPDEFAKFSDVAIDKAVYAYSELSNMRTHISEIRTEASNAAKTIDDIKRNFEVSKTSQTDILPEVLDEAIKHLETLKQQFEQLTIQIAKAAYSRAESLDKDIEEFLMSTDNAITIGYDEIHENTNPDRVIEESVISMMKLKHNRIFMEHAKEYFAKRKYMNEGLHTIYEAETSASSVDVDNTSDKSSSGSDDDSEDGLWARFKNWIKTFFNKLFNKAKKKVQMNQSFVNVFKTVQQSIDVSRIPPLFALNIFDTQEENTGKADENTIIQNIRALSGKNIEAEDVAKEIIPVHILNVKLASDDESTSIASKTKQYYLVKNRDFNEKTRIEPSAMKENLPKMLSFCEERLNNIKTEQVDAEALQKAVQDLAKSWDINIEESVADFILSEYDMIIEKGSGSKARRNSQNSRNTETSASSIQVAGQSEAEKREETTTQPNQTDDDGAKSETSRKKSVCSKCLNLTSQFTTGIENANDFRYEYYIKILNAVLSNVGLDFSKVSDDNARKVALLKHIKENHTEKLKIFSIIPTTGANATGDEAFNTAHIVLVNGSKQFSLYEG